MNTATTLNLEGGVDALDTDAKKADFGAGIVGAMAALHHAVNGMLNGYAINGSLNGSLNGITRRDDAIGPSSPPGTLGVDAAKPKSHPLKSHPLKTLRIGRSATGDQRINGSKDQRIKGGGAGKEVVVPNTLTRAICDGNLTVGISDETLIVIILEGTLVDSMTRKA